MKSFILLLSLLSTGLANAQTDPEIQLLEEAEQKLNAGQITISDVLSDDGYSKVFINPEYRKKIRQLLSQYPDNQELTMTTKDEPGERLIIHGKLTDFQPSTVIYIFHTDHSGLYTPEHTRGGYGSDNPRLFGYVKPNDKGEFTAKTIVPGCYPGGSLKHIHYQVKTGNSSRDGELIFDEKPYPPSLRQRNWARSVGFKIVEREWNEKVNCHVLEVQF